MRSHVISPGHSPFADTWCPCEARTDRTLWHASRHIWAFISTKKTRTTSLCPTQPSSRLWSQRKLMQVQNPVDRNWLELILSLQPLSQPTRDPCAVCWRPQHFRRNVVERPRFLLVSAQASELSICCSDIVLSGVRIRFQGFACFSGVL